MICKFCGNEFEPDWAYQQRRAEGICSDECVEKAKKQYRTENIDILMAKAGIPPKFIPIKTDVRKWLPLKSGLYIHGPVGVGKSVMASNIAREVIIEEGEEVKWVSYTEFIIQLQSSYRKEGGESPYEIAEKVAKFDGVLILDDIGISRTTDFAKTITYFLINYREQYLARTILTSNLSLDQLNNYIGDDRISSRITEICKVVELQGKDRRVSK